MQIDAQRAFKSTHQNGEGKTTEQSIVAEVSILRSLHGKKKGVLLWISGKTWE